MRMMAMDAASVTALAEAGVRADPPVFIGNFRR
jgi:hypothetical protein